MKRFISETNFPINDLPERMSDDAKYIELKCKDNQYVKNGASFFNFLLHIGHSSFCNLSSQVLF